MDFIKKTILLITIIILPYTLFAQNPDQQTNAFKASWESLDKRPTPQWWVDAKFGIFIHWGLYSVPAWSPRGTYAEWYWHAKDGVDQNSEKRKMRQEKVRAFHSRVYGERFEYKDFRQMFTCELFDPGHWAHVFKESGAKYIVLTSKHHDGYCLWPNKEASKSFGLAWNSVESGPKRDLVDELTNSVRNAGLKMGLYYSLWDWFNPYWSEELQMAKDYGKGLNKYIKKVMYPQFKELVVKYHPSVIFSDGDWWMDDEKWQTKPLLAWLFNNAPNKDEVVINDRWGKVRGQHGGYFTTEYGSGFDDETKPWEENRGIGMSFGYNREETFSDYNSAQKLLYMLVDIVSRGGNLLLDIGPTADGRIPVIMEERLLQIGEWLKVNGEAIYGTSMWRRDCQWSTGKRPVFSKDDHHYRFPLFEMTINPRPGNAVKEFWFTSKGRDLYALTPGWPKSDKIFIDNLLLSKQSKIQLLGCEKTLKWKRRNGGVEIDLSNISIHDLSCQHISTFKLCDVK